MNSHQDPGTHVLEAWLQQRNLQPFPFQYETWQQITQRKNGLVNAPTGFGKTYAVFLGVLIEWINLHPTDYKQLKNNGLRLIWITPLRALAQDIARAMEEVIQELGMPWKVGVRNGDTSTKERAAQKKQLPEILIITPESLQLLLSNAERD
ncbi:MAG: DEAD/DEAH box helicase, partial [Chitinophagaceae bacterium]|nr:DEAD/DEAH box helicase [Chitinophagaceae bacterium]